MTDKLGRYTLCLLRACTATYSGVSHRSDNILRLLRCGLCGERRLHTGRRCFKNLGRLLHGAGEQLVNLLRCFIHLFRRKSVQDLVQFPAVFEQHKLVGNLLRKRVGYGRLAYRFTDCVGYVNLAAADSLLNGNVGQASGKLRFNAKLDKLLLKLPGDNRFPELVVRAQERCAGCVVIERIFAYGDGTDCGIAAPNVCTLLLNLGKRVVLRESQTLG